MPKAVSVLLQAGEQLQQALQKVLEAVKQRAVEGQHNNVYYLDAETSQEDWEQFFERRRADHLWELLQELKNKSSVSNTSLLAQSPQVPTNPDTSVSSTSLLAKSPQTQPETNISHLTNPQHNPALAIYLSRQESQNRSLSSPRPSQVDTLLQGTWLVLDFAELPFCCSEQNQKVINGALKYLVLFLQDKAPSAVKICNGLLTGLPRIIGEILSLRTLELYGNNLSSLPESLGDLENLQWLGLSNNNLSSLPESLGKLQNLRELYLASNELKSLDEHIFETLNLQVLDLSDNPALPIEKILQKMPKKKLQKLYLANNKLTALLPSVESFQQLQELGLAFNPSIVLPKQLFQKLPNLNGLDLGENKLKSLPDGIGALTNLQWINLAGNNLTSLPESIGGLPNLKMLDLSGNQFSSLPKSFMQLVNSEEMEIIGLPEDQEERKKLIAKTQGSAESKKTGVEPSGVQEEAKGSESAQEETPDSAEAQATTAETFIKEHAKVFWDPIQYGLSNLYLDFNEKGIPQNLQLTVIINIIKYLALDLRYKNLASLSIKNGNGDLQEELQGEFQNIQQLKSLRELDLSDNKLTCVPDLGELQYLQELDLSGNQLKFVSGLGKLQRLQKLYLSNNQLKSVAEIFEESPLKELDLSNNQLESLPESLGKLPKLTYLNLSKNPSLSPEKFKEISKIPNLETLDLSGNQLKSVPEISEKSPLKELDLSNNQLESLPESLGKLPGLQKLYLSGNQLTFVPEISEESPLQELDLSNNQLESLPESLGSLENLQWLDLSGNNLTSLPTNFQKLLDKGVIVGLAK